MPNIIGNIFGGGQSKEGYLEPKTRTPIFALTEDGKNKLATLESGDIDYRIMSAIHAGYTLNIREVCQNTGLQQPVVREHLRTLHAQGYITVKNTYQ